TAGRGPLPRVGDDRQVRGVQHQLDRQEHEDRAAARDHADRAEPEQDRAERYEVLAGHAHAGSLALTVGSSSNAATASPPDCSPARWTRLTAATTPVRSSTATRWKASRYSLKSTVPTRSALPPCSTAATDARSGAGRRSESAVAATATAPTSPEAYAAQRSHGHRAAGRCCSTLSSMITNRKRTMTAPA